MIATVLFGLFVGALAAMLMLATVMLLVGDPHMLWDMWECRLRPIKRWRERRR